MSQQKVPCCVKSFDTVLLFCRINCAYHTIKVIALFMDSIDWNNKTSKSVLIQEDLNQPIFGRFLLKCLKLHLSKVFNSVDGIFFWNQITFQLESSVVIRLLAFSNYITSFYSEKTSYKYQGVASVKRITKYSFQITL